MQPSSPMALSAMCEGWRGRSGGGGPNQARNQKPKTKIKQKRMKHALLNATNANLSSRKQCNHNNTLYPKTLTAELQFFQMRKMNQR
jgi:hypothetical protein